LERNDSVEAQKKKVGRTIARLIPHLCGLPRLVRQRRILMMLKLRAFVDESSSGQKDKAVFLMGGWVADVDAWERFTEDWDKELSKPPAIEYFKHCEAKRQEGQFEGVSATDADRKILNLASVIERHLKPNNHHYGILTGLKPEVLRILLKGAPATKKQVRSVLKMTTPYDFCFHSIAGLILAHQCFTLGSDQPVDFIFDSNSQFDDCNKIYREFKTRMRQEMAAIAGTMVEGDDEELAPLQAADLLVGEAGENIRIGKPSAAFRLINRGDNRVLFAPLKWGEDAVLTGFAGVIQSFSVLWSSLMLEKARTGKLKR
jgi:hypothetical protein